jgi:S1-C subfamily serine protease
MKSEDNIRRSINIIPVLCLAIVLAACSGRSPMSTSQIVEKMASSTVKVLVGIPDAAQVTRDGTTGAPIVVQSQVQSVGSGIVHNDGYIITSAQVVKGATRVEILVAGQEPQLRQAAVVGVSPCDDLAVLNINDTTGLTPVAFSKADQLKVGDTVVAIGFSPNDRLEPMPTVAQGIVSQLNNAPDVSPSSAVIKTDMTLSYGKAGGPLVNQFGEVIGVNTRVFAQYDADGMHANYAIGGDHVQSVVDAITQGESKSQWLGMGLVELRASSDVYYEYFQDYDRSGGLFVQSVEAGSDAERLGVKPGHLLTALKGEPVDSIAEVCRMLRVNPGGLVNVTFQYRAGDTLQTLNGSLTTQPLVVSAPAGASPTTAFAPVDTNVNTGTIDVAASGLSAIPDPLAATTAPISGTTDLAVVPTTIPAPAPTDSAAVPPTTAPVSVTTNVTTTAPLSPTAAAPAPAPTTDPVAAQAALEQYSALRAGFRNVLAETFDNRTSLRRWRQADEAAYTLDLRDNLHTLSFKQKDTLILETWREQALGGSYIVEMAVDVSTGTPGSSPWTGIAFDTQEDNSGSMYFMIRKDGGWLFITTQNGQTVQERSATGSSSAIAAGTNRLWVVRLPDKVQLWVNSQLITTQPASPFGGGYAGVVAFSGNADLTGPVTSLVDDLFVLRGD